METSKTKNGKSKTAIFFLLKFVKMKKFFIILSLKQPNSEERIFAVYKYSKRLLIRTLSPKFLSNNLSLWLFYGWHLRLKLLSSRISYFTTSYWFQKVILLFLSYFSLSEFNAQIWKFANEFASISDT